MSLEVSNLSITNNQQQLFEPVSFTIQKGQILSVMGPSGCGKSTLLSAIAGHLDADFSLQGQMVLQNQSLNELSADQRKIGMMFQDDLLFPHLNVWQNLAFALPKALSKKQRQQKAISTLKKINLLQLANKMPDQISGGQRSRISLMRSLLAEPQAILLDEPFSKLDKQLRSEFRSFVFEQIKQLNIPALMVTHDEDDVPQNGQILEWPWHEHKVHNITDA